MQHHILASCLLFPLFVSAQEFTVHPNGLIYTEGTMGKLGFIVDSLNQKFQSCTVGRSFRSLPTAAAIVLRPQGAHSGLEKALKDRITVQELEERFGIAGDVDTVFVAFIAGMDDGDSTTRVMRLDLADGINEVFELEEPLSEAVDRASTDWFFEHWEYDGKSTWQLMRCIEAPVAHPLPAEYARMVEYVDCLVDTAGRVMVLNGEDPYARHKPGTAAKRWLDFVAARTDKPDCERWTGEKQNKDCVTKWERWEKRRDAVLDTLRTDPALLEPLQAAYAEVLEEGGGDERLEADIGRFLGMKEEFEMKRRRMVIGGCSQDSRPREHALSIAMLAAETISWPVFLRAHLDIMNDRFHRMSDGSYAWRERNTYLRELEELHIDVPGLVIGSCLRASDAPGGHYSGSVGRVGRALAETRDQDLVEERMLGMIRDAELDLFNRTGIWYLFLNYCHNLKDKDDAQALREQVMEAATTFPGPLARTAMKKD